MSRYEIFKKLLECVADISEVKDANLRTWCEEIDIYGVGEGFSVRVNVSFPEGKEVVENA